MATKFIHCKTYSTFNSKKLSALVENTSYTVGVDGSRTTGTPEINYLDIVFIQDTAQIWTHGKLYENTTYSFSGGTNGFTITPYNGSKPGKPTTVKVTPSIANASSTADGLMSKATAEALSSYSPYTFLYNVDGDVTQGSDKVNVHWTQFCDYVDYSKNNFTENIESHYVDFDIPAATTEKAGVMSASDKSYLNFLRHNVINSSDKVLTSASITVDDSSATLSFNTVNRDVDGSVMREPITVDIPMVSYDSVNGDKAGLMSVADKHKLDNTNIGYGTCTTAAATAAKTVSLVSVSNWQLQAGSVVYVKCSYTNTANNPTLNVNGTGAKYIYYNGSQITTGNKSYATYAGRLMKFIYDGTYYVFAGWDVDNNSTYANYSFGNGYATCATAASTTAKTATYDNYSLVTGGIVAVKFTYAVPANSTLNINSKGAKSIYYKGAAIKSNVISANSVALFVYDGTNYVLLSVDKMPTATTSTEGLMSASDKVKLNNLKNNYETITFYDRDYCNNSGIIVDKMPLDDIFQMLADYCYSCPTDAHYNGENSFKLIIRPKTSALTEVGPYYAIFDVFNTYESSPFYPDATDLQVIRFSGFVNTAAVNSSNLTGGYCGILKYDGSEFVERHIYNLGYSVATTTTNGLMSAADKHKLDGIESGADSIVISKTSAGGKTTASFTVNGGTATTFDIYGITDTYNTTSASSTYSLSQLGAKNLYNAVLSKAGGEMNSDARISASGGSLYLGNANNSGWLYLQDCASLKNDTTNTYWYIKNDGNSLFQTADIKTTLTLNNSAGNYNGIIFKFGDAVGTHIYQTYDSNNSYYSLTIDGNILIGGSGKGNLNVNGVLKAQGGNFEVLSDGAYWRSDKRFKDNISNARNLNIDSLIREFDWKDTGNHSWGFIALELLEVLPEAVNYDELIDRYSVNYDVAHSAAIASLSAKIELLESRIKELEK